MKLWDFTVILPSERFWNAPEVHPIIKQQVDELIQQQLDELYPDFTVDTQYDGLNLNYTVHCTSSETIMLMRIKQCEQQMWEDILDIVDGSAQQIDVEELFSVKM